MYRVMRNQKGLYSFNIIEWRRIMREKILNMLEKNGRIDIKDMATMLGTNETVIANEMADMEKEHIICGYHTLINWDNTSDEKVTALIEIKVTPQRGVGFDSCLLYTSPSPRDS